MAESMSAKNSWTFKSGYARTGGKPRIKEQQVNAFGKVDNIP